MWALITPCAEMCWINTVDIDNGERFAAFQRFPQFGIHVLMVHFRDPVLVRRKLIGCHQNRSFLRHN